MSVGTILLIILVLILVGAIPVTWGRNRSWGYGLSGVGLIVVILLVLVLMGRI